MGITYFPDKADLGIVACGKGGMQNDLKAAQKAQTTLGRKAHR